MKILTVGAAQSFEEVKQKFGDDHLYLHANDRGEAKGYVAECDVVFDFLTDGSLQVYSPASIPIFLNSTFSTLRALAGNAQKDFFGFCGLPTFLNRELLEVSIPGRSGLGPLQTVCEGLNTDYRIVADCVGMVTPRVICMIINEAFCAVEEGTASREDIDLAMKLGTNYPFGPFEWCERIGQKNVVLLLDALYKETGSERYKACSLLRN